MQVISRITFLNNGFESENTAGLLEDQHSSKHTELTLQNHKRTTVQNNRKRIILELSTKNKSLKDYRMKFEGKIMI